MSIASFECTHMSTVSVFHFPEYERISNFPILLRDFALKIADGPIRFRELSTGLDSHLDFFSLFSFRLFAARFTAIETVYPIVHLSYCTCPAPERDSMPQLRLVSSLFLTVRSFVIFLKGNYKKLQDNVSHLCMLSN